MLQQKGQIIFNEILQQPETWIDCMKRLNEKRQDIANWFRQEAFGQIVFMGAGSSYNAGVVGAHNFNSLTGVTSFAFPSSEVFSTAKLPYDDRRKTLVVVFSRSGQSQETLWAIDKIKALSKNSKILCLCPYGESEMLKKADMPLVLEKAKEEAPVATKSFTSFIFCVKLLIAILTQNMSLINELAKVPEMFDVKKHQPTLQKMSSAKFAHVAFCGSGPTYGLAMEGSLLVKKISTTSGEYQHTMEMRHGHDAGLHPQCLVVIFATDALKKGEGIVAGEMAPLKAVRMVVGEEADARLGICDYVFNLKSGLSMIARDVLMIPIAQVLAFYLAIAKGYNPDKPKHIIPVVTWKEPFFEAGK